MHLLVFLLLAALALPAGAQAAERLPQGSTVAGVDLSGLGPNGAKRELRRVLSAQHQRPLDVSGRGRTLTFPATRAGLTVDYAWMIKRAFRLAAKGQPVSVGLQRSIDGKRLGATVSTVAARLYKPGRNARVRYGVKRIARIRHRFGLAVDRDALRKAIVRELLGPTAARLVKARFRRAAPPVTTRELRRIHHTFISVDRDTFTLRLFKRLRVVKRYRIAVGAAGFATPRGLRRILSKTVNPAWHAPNRPWAGQYAGQTIPAGDPRNPLKARFMALGNGYGIHGTAEEWSLGTRASHGCIRMRVGDVKNLFARVYVGTPVLIR